jgi:uncharacterized membrane protein HdeD (DUF308 family)
MIKKNNLFYRIVKTIFNDQDVLIRDIAKFSLFFASIGTPFSLIFFGIDGMFTFAVCSILMLLNLGWLKELVDLITSRSSEKKAGTEGLAGFFFMYLLFGLCLYVIIAIRGVELVPLLLGISTLVFGTFCVSMKELLRHSRE